jgi:hypothetical protein
MNRVQEASLGIDRRHVRRPGFRFGRGFLLEIGNLIEGISMKAGREWMSLSGGQLEQITAQIGAKAGG